MKKIIIIALATLSTGIVLSATIKNNDADTKSKNLEIKKDVIKSNKSAERETSVLATAD